MNFLKKLLQQVVNLLVPEEKKISALLELPPEDMRRILPASKILSAPDVYPLFDYSNKAVKMIVWSVKYRRNRSVSERLAGYLSEEIAEILEDTMLFEGADKKIILVPIPMSRERMKEKGFNQCEDLCLGISRNLPWLEYEKVLLKNRETPRQTKLSREERLRNVKESFAAKNAEKIKNKIAVVVDDVHTTGATFAEAKRVLEKAGAKKVLGFFIAH